MDTLAGRNLKVVLLGSSRLMLQQGLTESLAGRFETIYIPHWSYSEMNEAFGWSVEQYIWNGAYPGAANLINDKDRWADYIRNSLIETSISRDIIMLTKVEKPALLRHAKTLIHSQISSLQQCLDDTNVEYDLGTSTIRP